MSHIHVYIYIYAHTRTYTYIYIYIHIYTCLASFVEAGWSPWGGRPYRRMAIVILANYHYYCYYCY